MHKKRISKSMLVFLMMIMLITTTISINGIVSYASEIDVVTGDDIILEDENRAGNVSDVNKIHMLDNNEIEKNGENTEGIENEIFNTLESACPVKYTPEQAIAWVQALEGREYDYDGKYETQCVDLIAGYYAFLGTQTPGGNAYQYATNSIPDNWQRIKGGKPQKGDILIYSGNSDNTNGHVAIYESDYVLWHGRWNGDGHVQKTTKYKYDGLSNPYWGLIRPEWTRPPLPAISDVQVTNITDKGFTVSCVLNDPASYLMFPTWTEKNDQDDIQWYKVTTPTTGTRYSKTVSISNHNNERGTYIVAIYGYDSSKNVVCSYNNFTVVVPSTYTVSYNMNGGIGGPTASQTKNIGTNLTLSSTKPTRVGYTFSGWNTKIDGSGTSYAAGATYSANTTITLYAQWTPNVLTIKYNVNGGAADKNAEYYKADITTYEQKIKYGSDDFDPVNFSSFGLYKTGYHRIDGGEWNTKADGSGTSFDQDVAYPISKYADISAGSKTITLYAQWTPNILTIKYNMNGGAVDKNSEYYKIDITTWEHKVKYGSGDFNLTNFSTFGLYKTGYSRIDGYEWNTKADGSGASFDQDIDYPISKFADISTGNKTITVYAQWTTKTYAVKYDANGGSGAPAQQTKTYGKMLTLSSTKPSRTGYTFKNWNTKADGSGTSYAPGASYTGNAALTLYAQWEPLLKVSPISDITFTGREVKPEVVITDNGKVLKKGTDYTVVYKNNINVNTIKKVNEGIGSDFNEKLPYVAVIGKGNYSGTIYVNFNIVALPISDTSGNPTAGITLNLSENLVCNNTSAQTVFKSIRSTVAMREGQDFLLSLKTVSAKDATGKAVTSGTSLTENRIPTGYTGSFQLKIMGKGNYSGTIIKNIYVQEKNHLLSTATITLGSNLKTTTYTGSAIQLTPGYYDKAKKQYFIVKNNAVSTTVASANDVFTVKCGNEYLVAGRDYTISYSGNNSVGTATMTLTGNGEYSGTKSITFKVAGAQFNVSKVTVSGIVDKDYTGKPVTQSGLKLYYSIGNGKTKELISGQDYVVSYKNNTNKGTATVQFTGLASAGYTGSFSKTFKINAVSINDTAKVIRGSSMSNISISYAKGGAKPSGMVALTNVSGAKLVEGKDYKITYKNNKIIANAMAVAPPIMIIQGVGNYTGNINIPFSITQKAITSADIKVTVSQIQYNPKAKDSYVYMPSVKVTDQGVNMVRNVDYTMEYVKNTKADYDAYQKKVANGTAKIEDCPRVVIRAIAGGNYTGTDALVIELPIYPSKIKNTNVKIIITEMTYSGMQLTPKVAVYYNDDPKAMQRAKNITNEKELLALGFVKLTANTDYVLEYGTNIVSGRNKGKVTIIGTGKTFGGKITGSFTINAKELKIIE